MQQLKTEFIHNLGHVFTSEVSDLQPFWHQGLVSWNTIFPQMAQGCGGGDRFLDDFSAFRVFICLLLAVLGLPCCLGLSPLVVVGGYSRVWCTGFSSQWLLPLWSSRVWAQDFMVQGLSSSAA